MFLNKQNSSTSEDVVNEQQEKLSKAEAILEQKMAELEDEEEEEEEEITSSEKTINLVFRNYTPRDPELKKYALKQVHEERTAEMLKNAISSIVKSGKQQDIELIPQKVNWDLKRDVLKQLKQLNVKTQKAIAELLKEKIEQENEELSDED